MNDKERAVMQQALEALERWRDWDDSNNTAAWGLDDEEAVTALREALAEQNKPQKERQDFMDGYDAGMADAKRIQQAEQEPVAEVRVRPLQGYESTPKIDVKWLVRPTPGFLYAAPVRTKDLTDDEIDYLIDDACQTQMPYDMFARAVIAADREKNK